MDKGGGSSKVDKREGGGGRPMWIIFLFYNIIIKCRNVDKGGGGEKRLSTKCR